jgi:hypothetical protein
MDFDFFSQESAADNTWASNPPASGHDDEAPYAPDCGGHTEGNSDPFQPKSPTCILK